MIRNLFLGLLVASVASSLANAQISVISCEPGTSGVIGCPCANPPAGLGRGCNNSLNTGGAALTATGTPLLSADNIQFNCTNIVQTQLDQKVTEINCTLSEGFGYQLQFSLSACMDVDGTNKCFCKTIRLVVC